MEKEEKRSPEFCYVYFLLNRLVSLWGDAYREGNEEKPSDNSKMSILEKVHSRGSPPDVLEMSNQLFDKKLRELLQTLTAVYPAETLEASRMLLTRPRRINLMLPEKSQRVVDIVNG